MTNLGALLHRSLQHGTPEARLLVFNLPRRKTITLPPLLILTGMGQLLPSLWALAGTLDFLLRDGKLTMSSSISS